MNNINTPAIETQRLILRRFERDDLPALFAVFSDKETNVYLPWFPLRSMDEARDFWQRRYAGLYRQERAYQYAICLKSDDMPIGYINVSMDESHDLGYGLRREFWGRAIAAEAGGAVIERVKADGMAYITATHDRNNPRSGAVMRRLGMRYQYSYEELWQPKNIQVVFRMYQLNLDGKQDRVYKKYWDGSDVHFIEAI